MLWQARATDRVSPLVTVSGDVEPFVFSESPKLPVLIDCSMVFSGFLHRFSRYWRQIRRPIEVDIDCAGLLDSESDPRQLAINPGLSLRASSHGRDWGTPDQEMVGLRLSHR